MRRRLLVGLCGLLLAACTAPPPADPTSATRPASPPPSPSPALPLSAAPPAPFRSAGRPPRPWQEIDADERAHGHRLTVQDRASGVTIYHADGTALPDGVPAPRLDIEGEGGYTGPLTVGGLRQLEDWLDGLHGEAGR